ncbi:Vps36-domain-containing protein, partial [Nadsonia fulvescens var. elongata DSM 6958]
MKIWDPVELTNGFRPVLDRDQNENEILILNNVGLYEGKYKVKGYQNGRVYLTTHRVCFVDDENPQKNNVAIDLRKIKYVEFQSGFLRSSPKVTLVLKSLLEWNQDQEAGLSEHNAPEILETTWICPICFFSNLLPPKFKLHESPTPRCQTCGVEPDASVIEDSILFAIKNNNHAYNTTTANKQKKKVSGFPCPRCTFMNHPSLHSCEICGARLVSNRLPATLKVQNEVDQATLTNLNRNLHLADENEFKAKTANEKNERQVIVSYIKLSFRGGGERACYEKLKKVLKQKSWLTSVKNGATKNGNKNIDQGGLYSNKTTNVTSNTLNKPARIIGIHGLQQQNLQKLDNNSAVLGGALQDLQTLMTRAKEVIALADNFSKHIERQQKAAQGTNALSISGLAVTKDMAASDDAFYSEIARQIAEFLAEEDKNGRSLLAKSGGIITLIDLFVIYNRARGISLVSPHDLYRACEKFEPLKLPVRLKTFKSGVIVIKEAYRTDEVIIRRITEWVNHIDPLSQHGVSILDVGEQFGWSVGVAKEELELAELNGKLCRDEVISGIKFFVNKF